VDLDVHPVVTCIREKARDYLLLPVVWSEDVADIHLDRGTVKHDTVVLVSAEEWWLVVDRRSILVVVQTHGDLAVIWRTIVWG